MSCYPEQAAPDRSRRRRRADGRDAHHRDHHQGQDTMTILRREFSLSALGLLAGAAAGTGPAAAQAPIRRAR